MRNRTYDVEPVLALARDGYSAPLIIEQLGLNVGERSVQKLVARYVGHRPTHKSVERPNVMREAVVAYMEKNGLDKSYCYVCGKKRIRLCAIHPLGKDIDSFVFVCADRCAAAGDF